MLYVSRRAAVSRLTSYPGEDLQCVSVCVFVCVRACVCVRLEVANLEGDNKNDGRSQSGVRQNAGHQSLEEP